MCLGKGCENMKRRKAGDVPAFGSPGKMKKFRRIFSAFLLSLILLAAAEAPVLSKSESIAGQYEVSVTEMEKKTDNPFPVLHSTVLKNFGDTIQSLIWSDCAEKQQEEDSYETDSVIVDDLEKELSHAASGREILPVDLSPTPVALVIMKWILISFGAWVSAV